jgi:hypothetical protein
MLRLNPKIIKMGKKLYDDAVLVRIDSLSNPREEGLLPMSDEQRDDLGSPITWALALGMTTSEAILDEHDEDSLEWITGVHSLVDLMGDIPWTNIDGNHVATDPQIFPKYNIYFEQDNVQYDVNWKDFLSFTNTYLAGISLNDFTKEFHGLPAEVFIRHNETQLLFPLSIFEWRYNAINNKMVF